MKYMKFLVLIIIIGIIFVSNKSYKENVQNHLEEDPKEHELVILKDVDLSKLELIDTLADGSILYFQKSAHGNHYYKQEYGERIIIKIENTFYLLIEDQPSRPRVGKDKDKVMFLDSVGFETRANLFVYDVHAKTINQITDHNYAFDPNDSNTIKFCDWIDEDLAIVIIGFDTGTITQGGDVFLIEISSGVQTKVFTANEGEEVVDIYFDGDEVVFEIVYYTDDNFNVYEYREERHEIEDIIGRML